jgi:putative Mn2+ efflux pump MntP
MSSSIFSFKATFDKAASVISSIVADLVLRTVVEINDDIEMFIIVTLSITIFYIVDILIRSQLENMWSFKRNPSWKNYVNSMLSFLEILAIIVEFDRAAVQLTMSFTASSLSITEQFVACISIVSIIYGIICMYDKLLK